MELSSRRKFIHGAALTGLAACCLPSVGAFALTRSESTKTKVKDGAVILFQGDSITDGNRGRNTDPNHIMGHGYAFSIASRIGADFPEKRYHFYNRGISGNKVIDLEKRWQTDTLDLKPDVLSILVGVNDSSSVVFNWEPIISIEKYTDTYQSLIEQTIAKFPDIILVLCEPFIQPVGRVKENWDAYHSDILKRQAVVRKLAEQYQTVFVGFQEVFDKATEKAPADYWIWDGVHPTVAGHELMAREWIRQVEKRMTF
jgi:lysophospholipase L1-like esterase